MLYATCKFTVIQGGTDICQQHYSNTVFLYELLNIGNSYCIGVYIALITTHVDFR